MDKNIIHHVIPNPEGGWDIRRTGCKRPSVHTKNKDEALRRGRKISRNQGGELIIHRKNGIVQSSESYGKNGKLISSVNYGKDGEVTNSYVSELGVEKEVRIALNYNLEDVTV